MVQRWLTVLAFSFGAAANLEAAPVPVFNTNDSLAGSLRQAVQDASPGDTIVFQIPTSSPGYSVSTGTYTIGLTSAELLINKNLTIDGGGQRIAVQRNGAARFRIFNVAAGKVVISGLTIANGDPATAAGGGIFNAAVLTVRNCTITGNGGRHEGAGIYNDAGGNLTVENCTLTNNQSTVAAADASGHGAGISNHGTLTVRLSTIVGNRATPPGCGSTCTGFAGGIYNPTGATAVIRSTIVASNSGLGQAPDVFGQFMSEGYNLIGNGAGGSGFTATGDQVGATPAQVNLAPLQDNGGPARTMRPQPGSLAIDQGKRGVDANSQPINTDQRGFTRPVDLPGTPNAVGGDGSDIGAVETAPAQSGTAFTVTNSSGHHDAVCSADDCTWLDAIGAANANADPNTIVFQPGIGGVIIPQFEAQITTPLTINGPGARRLFVSGGNARRVLQILPGASSVSISGLTLANGFVSGDGGAIHNGGPNATFTDCTISGSQAQVNAGIGGNGGGIYNSGTSQITLLRCTLAANTATGFGGGAIFNVGTLTATNCTFFANTAPGGGGILSVANNGASLVTLRNSTITSNTATSTGSATAGGGGYYGEGAVGNSLHHFSNTILAGNINAVNPDLRGYGTSEGNNLIGNLGQAGSGFTNGTNGDKVGVAANLGTFSNHGGQTHTVSLLPTSPARDMGNNATAAATDQRGYPRIGTSDIGAFEFGSGLLHVTDIARSGNDVVVSFTEAVASSSYRLERKVAITDATWQPIKGLSDLNAGATGPAQITHPGGVNFDEAFYRVRLLP